MLPLFQFLQGDIVSFCDGVILKNNEGSIMKVFVYMEWVKEKWVNYAQFVGFLVYLKLDNASDSRVCCV